MTNLPFNKIGLLGMLLISQISHASVVLLEDARLVTGQPTPAPFSHWVTTAQDSLITTDLMRGLGEGTYQYSELYGWSSQIYSYFYVRFLVEQDQVLKFDASFATKQSSCKCSQSSFSLVGPAGFARINGLASDTAPSDPGLNSYYGTQNLTVSTLIDLLPGEYALTLSTFNWVPNDGTRIASSSWSFQAEFMPAVPVPAAGWMMLSALGAIGATRRLQKSSAPA